MSPSHHRATAQNQDDIAQKFYTCNWKLKKILIYFHFLNVFAFFTPFMLILTDFKQFYCAKFSQLKFGSARKSCFRMSPPVSSLLHPTVGAGGGGQLGRYLTLQSEIEKHASYRRYLHVGTNQAFGPSKISSSWPAEWAVDLVNQPWINHGAPGRGISA